MGVSAPGLGRATRTRGDILGKVLVVENGELVIDETGERIKVTANAREVHVGCVTLTRVAWLKLKKLVEDKGDDTSCNI